jgi:hypothetical protein
MTEELIYPPTVYTYSRPGGGPPLEEPVEIPYGCYADTMARSKVGDPVVQHASAPGTGCVVYRITRMDATGVYGEEIFNNVRELTPEEVR